MSFAPAFRAADLSDATERTFVRSTWSRYFKMSRDAGMIFTDDWAVVMHRQIDRVLDRDGARAILCFESTSPTFFYGWIAGDTSGPVPVVFFAFVKPPYQRQGLARQLLEQLGVDAARPFEFTCRTSEMLALKDKIPLARYNPLEVRFPKGAKKEPWPRRPTR